MEANLVGFVFTLFGSTTTGTNLPSLTPLCATFPVSPAAREYVVPGWRYANNCENCYGAFQMSGTAPGDPLKLYAVTAK